MHFWKDFLMLEVRSSFHTFTPIRETELVGMDGLQGFVKTLLEAGERVL